VDKWRSLNKGEGGGNKEEIFEDEGVRRVCVERKWKKISLGRGV
jgi:hypothetical protein